MRPRRRRPVPSRASRSVAATRACTFSNLSRALSRFIALYRTICRLARALFARDFSWSASPGRFTSHDSSARGCGHLRVWGEREGLLRTPVCRAARGGGRVVVGRRFVWDAREGWTREARRRRAWDGGGRYIVSREVRVKCVCARARG